MEETLLKRILPHSMEAEQSVIGSMIMDREAIIVASEIVLGEDFYNKQYGALFDTMVELNDEGRPVDLVTLQDRLREKDVPPEVSSLEFIRDLITAVPTSANIKHYANIVAEKSTLRRLIRINEEIANTCYVGKDSLEDILADTEKRVFDLVQRRNTGEFVSIRQIVMNAMDNIEKASHNKGNVTGVATGFLDLDYRTAGMQPSDLILVAARPSMGKTAFVLNIAQYVAFKQAKTVAIFSLEMSKEQLVNRLFSLESHVDAQLLRTGNLKDTDWEKLIGQTIDDAVGEAFDKCSKMMGLGYPGGPVVDRLAKEGDPDKFKFSKPHVPGLDYSFSGIKTSLLYFVRDRMAEDPDFMEKNKADICASFQKALIDILMDKLIKAAKQTGIRQITIGGGVSANSGLRTRIVEEGRKRGWTTFLPEFKFTTDNAAMIAIAGWFHYMNGERTSLDVAPVSRLAEF